MRLQDVISKEGMSQTKVSPVAMPVLLVNSRPVRSSLYETCTVGWFKLQNNQIQQQIVIILKYEEMFIDFQKGSTIPQLFSSVDS